MAANNDDKKINRDLAIITKISEKTMDKLDSIDKRVANIETKIDAILLSVSNILVKVETIIKDVVDKCQTCAVASSNKSSEWLQKLVWAIIGFVVSGVGYLIVKLLEQGVK